MIRAFFKKQKIKVDLSVLLLVFLLTIFGVIMVYNASVAEAYRDFNDKYFYFKSQLVWAAVGLLLVGFVSQVKYLIFDKLSLPAFIFTLLLLVLVLILGPETQGSRRWLPVAGVSVQPSEMVKLTFVIYLASWLASKKRALLHFLVLVALTCGLVVLEPDLGTSLIIAIVAFIVYYISGAPLIRFLVISFIGSLMALLLVLISPYRRRRLVTFFDPTKDPLGSSYHIRQALIALGSGGLWGVGLGQSRQKYSYLPEVASDSIFAIIAEEVGFVGSLIFLGLIFWLIWKIFQIAKKAPDRFSQLLVAGIGSWLGFQTVFNLAAMVALVPLTGIPLPFVSYGGSSLIVTLVAMGIVLNISKYVKVKK